MAMISMVVSPVTFGKNFCNLAQREIVSKRNSAMYNQAGLVLAFGTFYWVFGSHMQ
jgi:hypothetical protein